MKITLPLLALLILPLFSTWATRPGNSGKLATKIDLSSPHLPKTVIFKVKPEFANQCKENAIGLNQFAQVSSGLNVKSVLKMFPKVQKPATLKNAEGKILADLSLIYILKYQASIPLEKVIASFQKSNFTLYAEPYYIPKHCATVNDPSVPQQYHLGNIKIFNAWDITKGDTNVHIGIVDSGTDWDHPDLQSNIAYNYADPIDGIDNDNDGYIDNFRGWDLAGSDLNNIVGDNNPMIMGNNNVHGSHVSGISAAATNNSTGGAGVAYNCRFLPVKCSADNDSAPPTYEGGILTGYQGIQYAADHGCKVINCSWGGTGFSQSGQDVIDYASINKGALVVCAAGNSSSTAEFYPACFKGVLSVAASDNSNLAASFTNRNFKVAVTAPGVNIYSTLWNNNYAYLSGTSMASPVVAGVAALLFSIHPNYTPEQVRTALMATSQDSLYKNNPGAQFKNRLGSGLVNAFKAVSSNPSGIVFKNPVFTDGNDNIINANDTFIVSGDFVNILAKSSPKASAKMTFVGTGNYFTTVKDSINLGVIAAGGIKNIQGAFKFKVRPLIPPDYNGVFILRITDSGQTAYKQVIEFTFAPTYRDLKTSNLTTSITSIGRIGYVNDNAATGSGFKFMGQNLIFEMGLIQATAKGKLSNTVRPASTSATVAFDQDFASVVAVHSVSGTLPGVHTLQSTFNDSKEPSIPTTRVNTLTTQYSTSADSAGAANYVVVRYSVINKNTTLLDSFYLGIFADFDISANGAKDRADWDAIRRLGYVQSTETNGLFAGIAHLDSNLAPTYNAISNAATGSSPSDFGIYDGFTDAEKIGSLTGGLARVSTPAILANSEDVSMVCGYGPVSIAGGDSASFAFVLTAGNNLQSIQKSVDNARGKSHVLGVATKSNNKNLKMFPNPVQAGEWVNIPMDENLTNVKTLARLTNSIGQVAGITLEQTRTGLGFSTAHLAAGIYLLKMDVGSEIKTAKLVIR